MKKKVISNSWLDDGKYLWFTQANSNGLIKVDYMNGYIVDYFHIPVVPEIADNLFGQIIRFENKLLLVPNSSSHIAIFNIDSNDFDMIALREPMSNHKEIYYDSSKFHRGFVFEKYIYMLPWSYPAIIRLDTVDGEIIYIDEWVDQIDGYIDMDYDGYVGRGEVWLDDRIVAFPLGCTSGFIKLDIKTLDIHIDLLNSVHKHFFEVGCIEAKQVWTIGKEGDKNSVLEVWNLRDKTCFEFTIEETEGINGRFYPVFTETSIILFSFYDNNIFVVNPKEPSYYRANDIIDSLPKEIICEGYISPGYVNNKLMFFLRGSNLWCVYDFMSNKLSYYNLEYEIDDITWHNIKCRAFSESLLIPETKDFGVNEFISYL